ncbi:MAG: bifunctional 5,10-methylenetetrahydrofolate dehydrogenase/5,10-methenyltetrahydrofolate cyclohydrolase [Firmicutes bacterium]|nr:bifunctional 5,10-methylenetetrahydrofolate dehydrogenase/5,10-methenyltetrahydrofolate cyclohydrolase [Bacillota bacterium]
MNKIIDGKLISSKIKEKIKEKIQNLDVKPTLVVIQVGNNEASNVYVKNKKNAAINVGMNFNHIHFEETINEQEIIKTIEKLNKDNTVNGIIVQLPLPHHLNSNKIINHIVPIKDVDGLTTINLGKLFNDEECLTSCTPAGIIELLKAYNIKLEGKCVTIVGRSTLVGKPLIHMLLKENATVVVCHSKTVDLKRFTTKADILIVVAGKKHLICSEMVKNGAIIIDVGINKIDNKLYGDVNFNDVLDKVSYITPVPGGVGPVTIAILLNNTLKSYNMMNKKD